MKELITPLDILIALEQEGVCEDGDAGQNDDHLKHICFVCCEEYDCHREEWTWEYTPKHLEGCKLLVAIQQLKSI